MKERAQDILKNVAESLGVNFAFEDWTTLNQVLDKTPLPAIAYILPASGEFNFTSGFIKDNQNGMLAFLDKAVIDANGNDDDCIVDKMKLLAKKFIVELNKTNHFESIGGKIQYRAIYQQCSSVVTGIAFEVTLKELKGICERNL